MLITQTSSYLECPMPLIVLLLNSVFSAPFRVPASVKDPELFLKSKAHVIFSYSLPSCLILALSSFAPDGSQKKPFKIPPLTEQRPLSPPSPPPPPPPPPPAPHPSEGNQPGQDISPAVAAALLQLISQQDADSQPGQDPSPLGHPPPSSSPAAEAPSGLVTATATKTPQFVKDQDLRYTR